MTGLKLDPTVRSWAARLKKEVITTLPDNVQVINSDLVRDRLNSQPCFVPTLDGRIFFSRYDQKIVSDLANFLMSHFKITQVELIPCAPQVTKSLCSLTLALSTEVNELDKTSGHVDMVNLFRQCLRENATDLHIIARKKSVRLVRRLDGDLHELKFNKMYGLDDIYRICSATMNYTAVDTGQSDDNFNPLEPQDSSFTIQVDHFYVSIRYAHVPEIDGLDVVLRVLPQSDNGSVDIRTLHYPLDQLKLFLQASRLPFGIVLCCGPTGAGKSTALAGMLSLQPETKKIYSYEHPVENKLSNVTQVPVNPKSDTMNWEYLAQNNLRLDPDIIFYGEIRNKIIAEEAFRAASTGHLVYSTLHTNDAPGCVARLFDLGISKEKLGMPNMLRLIIAQCLIPKNCVHCATYLQDHSDSNQEYLRLADYFGKNTSAIRIKGPGCSACGHLGTSGRQVVSETIFIDEKGREYIREGDIPGWVIYLKKQGWVDKTERAVQYINNGIFDPLVVEEKLGVLFGIDNGRFSYESIGGLVKSTTQTPVASVNSTQSSGKLLEVQLHPNNVEDFA